MDPKPGRYLPVETRSEKIVGAGPEEKINGWSTTYIFHVRNPFAQIPPTLPQIFCVVYVGTN